MVNKAPRLLRRPLAGLRLRTRALTSPWRMLPNVLIIGAQRCGTTSLFRYLISHPDVVGSYRKEVGFFSHHHSAGMRWYKAHFPHTATWLRSGATARTCVEATPEYLLDPRAPSRVAAVLPGVRIITLLRDPVDRAVSHYLHSKRLGFETLPFEDAITSEEARLAHALDELKRRPNGPLPAGLRRYSYLARGRYAEQLHQWFAELPRDRFLIIKSEDLFARPGDTLPVVTGFLGLRDWESTRFRTDEAGRTDRQVAAEISAALRDSLRAYFQPGNQLLESLLQRPMNW